MYDNTKYAGVKLKECKHCHRMLTLDDFYKVKGTKDGRMGRCRKCHNKLNGMRIEKIRKKEMELKFRRNRQGESKVCPKCKIDKPLIWENWSLRSDLQGPKSWCRLCHNLSTKLKKQGITLDEFYSVQKAQEGRCAICRKSPEPKGQRPSLYIDHDHKTGKFRGLLCSSCNSGLGLFQDDISLLERAIEYLNIY